MRGRWVDLFLAAIFAFLAVGCASLAATALLGDGQGPPQFISAATATAAIFAAFAVWSVSDFT